MPEGKNKGTRSSAIQSTVDLAQSFLSIAGIEVPMTMSGVDQCKVWSGEISIVRNHAIIENHLLKLVHADQLKEPLYMPRIIIA